MLGLKLIHIIKRGRGGEGYSAWLINFTIKMISDLENVLFRCIESLSYLTGVTTTIKYECDNQQVISVLMIKKTPKNEKE